MKLEDLLEGFPILIPNIFLERFAFIWGLEQCSKMFSQISPRSYYYLKDLKIMHYNCCGLPYGKEDHTLLIDNKPNKALRNPKRNGFFFESFKGPMLSKNKVQWLDLTSRLCLSLLELLLAETICVHYDCMVKYFKPCLSSSSKLWTNIMKIWHYLSFYFSNLDCLNYLGFLRMFLLIIMDFFFSKFFKKSMVFFHNLAATKEFVFTNYYIYI
jgi:hypothetical protein